MESKDLGQYLRALRSRFETGERGVPADSRRKVAGLRREELAERAGVSLSYYTSLEQGRAVRASPEVLQAIARALDLGQVEKDHLMNLASTLQSWRPAGARVSPPLQPPETLVELLEAMPDVPVLAHDTHLDLVAANPMGLALYFPDSRLDAPLNLARTFFLEPSQRELYVDWETKAQSLTAMFRFGAGQQPDDTGLSDLIGELMVKSPDFERMWSQHQVVSPGSGPVELQHPHVGRLRVNQHALAVMAVPGIYLVASTAEPGSPSAKRLQLLPTSVEAS